MLKIDNQKNYYIQEVEKAYQEGYRFYINGGGSGACLIYKKVFLGEGRKIPLEAFVVNDSYYDMILGKQELVMCGHPIIPIRDIDLNDERIFICMGYTHYDFYDTDIVIPNIKGKFLIGDNFFTFDRSGKEQYLDYNFFNKHKKQFEKIYNKLEDEKSKAVLQAYINQKISGKFEYLSELWNLNQYYDDEIIDISKISGIVDCGAFDGDSYKAFIDAYYARTGKEYSEYAYLWEPEIKNIEVLHKKYDNNKKINIIEKAAWNTTEQLYFSGNGTGGGVEAGSGGNSLLLSAVEATSSSLLEKQ